jgi:hypothetical protein
MRILFKLGKTNGVFRQSKSVALEVDLLVSRMLEVPEVLGVEEGAAPSSVSFLLACYFFQFAKHMISSSH